MPHAPELTVVWDGRGELTGSSNYDYGDPAQEYVYVAPPSVVDKRTFLRDGLKVLAGLDAMNEKRRAFGRERQAEGRCVCGRALSASRRWQCDACAARQKASLQQLYRARRAAGLCTKCGHASEGKALCPPCGAQKNARARQSA